MATGPEGSSYAFLGKKVQDPVGQGGHRPGPEANRRRGGKSQAFARSQVRVQVGFVEGGVATEDDTVALDSLGTLGFEPVWIFSRKWGRTESSMP